jgi:hypothetical protein
MAESKDIKPRPADASLEAKSPVVTWDANERVEKFALPGVKSAADKPREWSEVITTDSGRYEVVLKCPNVFEKTLTVLTLTVPPGMVGIITVRTAAGLRDEAKMDEAAEALDN